MVNLFRRQPSNRLSLKDFIKLNNSYKIANKSFFELTADIITTIKSKINLSSVLKTTVIKIWTGSFWKQLNQKVWNGQNWVRG